MKKEGRQKKEKKKKRTIFCSQNAIGRGLMQSIIYESKIQVKRAKKKRTSKETDRDQNESHLSFVLCASAYFLSLYIVLKK